MGASSVRKTANALIIALFLGLIFSSPLAMVLGERAIWSETEKRSLALIPEPPASLLGLGRFFNALSDYLSDHFGFRDFYIYRYQRELDKRFNHTADNARVIKGLDGWYFLNEFGLIDDFTGKLSLSREQVGGWLADLQEKHDWLESRDIRFLYVVAPNKQSIYPQYLMKHALALKGRSRFEQVLEHTAGRLPDYVLNLHALFKAADPEQPLYYKLDTHWNKRGAYLALQGMIEKISGWFPAESFVSDFEFTADVTGIGGNTGQGGDLAQMLMQKDMTETYPRVREFERCSRYAYQPYRLSAVDQTPGRDSFVRRCAERKLKAVVFRDSFFVALEPFFSENFAEVVYLWKGYDQRNLEEILSYFKPDLVVELVVERHAFDPLLAAEKQKRTAKSAVAAGR